MYGIKMRRHHAFALPPCCNTRVGDRAASSIVSHVRPTLPRPRQPPGA